jgi:hypothetical protein
MNYDFKAFLKDTGKEIIDFNDQHLISSLNSNNLNIYQCSNYLDKNNNKIYVNDIVIYPIKYRNKLKMVESRVIQLESGLITLENNETKITDYVVLKIISKYCEIKK